MSLVEIRVRGRATPEELAALLAALGGATAPAAAALACAPSPGGYEAWRRARQAVNRPT